MVLYLVFFSVFNPNIIFVGLVTFVESIINFIIQVFWTKRLLPEYKIKYQYAKIRAVKELLFSGIWSSISSLGNNLLTGLTIIFVNVLYGATESGTLSIANTLPSLCTTIIMMMVNVFYPRLTNRYAENGLKSLEIETINSQKIMGIIICVPILLLIGLGKEFFLLWMPNENAAELQTASIIYLIPFVVQANMWTLTQVFPVLNQVKKPAIVMLIIGIINVLLCLSLPNIIPTNYLLIPIITSVLNVLYCVIFVPLFVSHLLSCSVKRYYQHLLKAALASAIVLLLTFQIKSLFICNSWFWFVLCGLTCAIVSYVAFLVIILDREQLTRLLEYVRKQR